MLVSENGNKLILSTFLLTETIAKILCFLLLYTVLIINYKIVKIY